jgi:hypothetical protein
MLWERYGCGDMTSQAGFWDMLELSCLFCFISFGIPEFGGIYVQGMINGLTHRSHSTDICACVGKYNVLFQSHLVDVMAQPYLTCHYLLLSFSLSPFIMLFCPSNTHSQRLSTRRWTCHIAKPKRESSSQMFSQNACSPYIIYPSEPQPLFQPLHQPLFPFPHWLNFYDTLI